MIKTKIVATLGPQLRNKKTLKNLVDAGLDVARVNFSHGNYKEHGESIDKLREVNKDVAIMMDTQGPEIRVGYFDGEIHLKKGMMVKLKKRIDRNIKDQKKTKVIPISNESFFEKIGKGDEILLDDGAMKLVVTSDQKDFEAKVVEEGFLSSRKSVNVPDKNLDLTSPTEKDKKDIEFGVKKDVDFVAASFIENADEIARIKEILDGYDSNIKIIAKIENSKAVDNIDEIIDVSDGVMVARGDLGVELAPSDVPLIQKEIIRKCNVQGKPVIIATQMLKSMTESIRPTRAEASDVANAVLDGADAVMLSEETATGRYPVESLRFLSAVIKKVEKTLTKSVHHTIKKRSSDVTDTICKNVWQACRELDIDYILVHTSSGSTAVNVSKYRPAEEIIAFTNSKKVKRQLKMVWGVQPYYIEFKEHFHDLIRDTTSYLKKKGRLTGEELLVITAGVPNTAEGITNLIEVRKADDILSQKK
ncbi:MAG: pyruvate kinase [Candidatus Thermoplasmatota archaeon]